MDVTTRLRLLTGPVRPFLFGKIRDAILVPVRVALAKRQVPTPVMAGRTLATGWMPRPSAAWLRDAGPDVVRFAAAHLAGTVDAYGIDRWRTGDADPVGVDVRSVHELSRMHPWCALALAAHIQPHARDSWCEALRDDILRWIEAYPVHTGIHWAMPMGVALRCLSMTVAWDWAKQTGWTDPQAEGRIAASVMDHTTMVLARRETSGGMATSHYLANLLGLLAAGRALRGEATAARLVRFAARELRSELVRQIYDDGASFEASTGYHRHVLDIVVQASTIMVSAIADEPAIGALLDEGWWRRIGRALQFQRVLDAAGMPLIGDNDDGMAIKLTGRRPDTSFLYDCSMRLPALADHWATDPQDADHAAWPRFGLDVIRSADIVITARCGPVGQDGKGGHAHNDQNSLTVTVDGEVMVVDPGCSVYTDDPEQRNRERSTTAHATVVFPDAEQVSIPDDRGEGLFWLVGGPSLGTAVVERSATRWHGIVHYAGTRRRHERVVDIAPESITVTDTVPSRLALPPMVVLPLGDTIRAIADGPNALRLVGRRARLRLVWSGGAATVVPWWVAPRFAERRPSTAIHITMEGPSMQWTLSREP